MISRTHAITLLVLLSASLVAGCGGTTPYVFKEDEFDRSAKTFNKELTDREDVTICYNGVGTSDGEALRVAQAECARFGRSAEPFGETFGACPLFTPVEARFLCVRTAASAPQ